MKSVHTVLYSLVCLSLASSSIHALANPLDDVDWVPPAWSADSGKSDIENLITLLAELESAASEEDLLWFLELHFSSMRRLVERYPPSQEQTVNLLDTFSDPEKGAGLDPYVKGEREFLVAYESTSGGVLSYVRCTLPGNWQPQILYPLFVWGRGGGNTPYPGDILDRYDDQISGVTIPGTPSAVYKDGYTIIPGGLGGRSYTGSSGDDFIEGIETFMSYFQTDPRRLYMGGFSNGGKATYLIAAQTMERYHWAALGMCAPAILNNQLTPEQGAPLSNTPVWIAVGAEDTLTLTATRTLRDILTDLGNPPEHYEERAGIPHRWIWDFQNAMYLWMRPKEYLHPGGPPSSPTNLRVKDVGDTGFTLEWDLPEGSDSQVMVEWMLVGSGSNFLPVPRTILPGGTTTFTEKTLNPGASYRYRVWLYGKTGDSGYSNEIEVTTKTASNVTWANWPMEDEGWVNTEAFLGWIQVKEDWIWSTRVSQWMYLPESSVEASGAWIYFLI